MPLFETIHDLNQGSEPLRRRSYGVIDVEHGRLKAVHLRPWPKVISISEHPWLGWGFRQGAAGDRCWLYYNQPCRHRRFLALKFVISSLGATLETFRKTLVILDEIARLKQSHAIVCEARNQRISDRLLARWGWEPHLASSRRRHFIKRFYGEYPDPLSDGVGTP